MGLDPAQQRMIEVVVEAIGALVIGTIILLFGRKLSWLIGGITMAVMCVALVALIAVGVAYVQQGGLQARVDIDENILQETPALAVALLLAIVVGGIVGAVVLIRLPRVAAAIIGFALGAYVLTLVFELYNVAIPEWLLGILAIAAGIVFAIGAWRNADTALILSTTLIGANLLITGLNFNLSTSFSAIVWLILMLTGIIVQTYSLNAGRLKAKRKALVTATALVAPASAAPPQAPSK